MNPLSPPMPGLVWGRYPQRAEAAAPRRHDRTAPAGPALALATVRERQAHWLALGDDQHTAQLRRLRARLARDGWSGSVLVDALGCVAAACQQTLARCPYDTQLRAAAALLADQFVEMATGEGKTCAAALAAGVAALAGVPVHVMTANDYLVERDAAELRPLFARLGLRVGAVLGTSTPQQRRDAYGCDLTYTTAREVAFDYLRDGLADIEPGDELRQRAQLLGDKPGDASRAAPLLRGLCMAVLDEADSLLIDDASMPLVLSTTTDDPQQRAACFQALALARQLEAGRDFDLPVDAGVTWRPAGLQRLDTLCGSLGGAWHNRRHRDNLVTSALTALHLLQRDRHYLVRDGALALLDAQTGRIGTGRVWSNGLQTLVELKEGCAPSPATQTRAQISFQRFFARYLRLCGMSGTLAECRRELAAVHARSVVAEPPRLPSQRVRGADQWFVNAAQRRGAAVQRIAALQAGGRPVLVGTDSVAESDALAALLAAAGITHRVLNARHDAAEAQIVAAAGQRGAVTVATQMAGRGTDIALGPDVAALGGLHVLCCLDSLNPRLERQLVGRCARQGDPGSAETWRRLDAAGLAGWPRSSLTWLGRKPDQQGMVCVPAGLARRVVAWLGGVEERRHARQRRRLLEQDRQWQSRLNF